MFQERLHRRLKLFWGRCSNDQGYTSDVSTGLIKAANDPCANRSPSIGHTIGIFCVAYLSRHSNLTRRGNDHVSIEIDHLPCQCLYSDHIGDWQIDTPC